MDTLWTDLRFALRTLAKQSGFTLLAVLTLALGIGATTAIFSVVYGVLLHPLPYAEPERIMAVFELSSKGGWARVADPNFDDFRDQNHTFDALAKYGINVVSVSGTSQPTRTTIAGVTPGFLKVFGVKPVIGRDFTDADNKKGASPVVLASFGYWKQHLGSSTDLSKLQLKIDNASYSVIGVLPDGFQFPPDTGLWLPADLDGENTSRTSHNYSAVGRLRAGVSVAQANGDISAIARRIHDSSNEPADYLLKDAIVVPLQDSITRKVRSALLIVLGAVGFLLLVACANVANLMLAQASARQRELAIRSALGAARGRLVRQFLTETFLLALAGGSLGVVGAFAGVSGLLALAPSNLPLLESVSINFPVLAFAVFLSTAVAAGLGTFTALRATAGDPRNGLEGGHGQAGSQSSQRIGRAIVAAQVAITLILVVGAGLLGRSLLKVLEVNPGFQVDRIVTMDVSLPWLDDPKARAGQGVFFANLIDHLKQIPGVQKVGAASNLPLVDGGLPDGMFLLMSQEEVPKNFEGFAPFMRQKERQGNADFCVASSGYFQTLGIPLKRGRLFDERDGADAPHVAVISESLARTRWAGQDPIGHTIEFGNMDGDLRLLTIVGIVGDIHEYGLDVPARPTVYVNLVQRPRATMTIAMLSEADTQLVTTAARGILQELDPQIPAQFGTFAQIYSSSLGSRRFNLILLGSFAVTALLLATAGVFGVMAYSVSRRTREIGMRVALGALPGDVVRLVLGQGLRTVLVGVAIGLVGSLALTRTVESLLFGVTANDPLTFSGVILLLGGAALAACYLPARRASRVDPLVALRHD